MYIKEGKGKLALFYTASNVLLTPLLFIFYFPPPPHFVFPFPFPFSVRPILLTMNRKRGLKDSTNHAKRKAFPIIMRVVNDNDCQ